MLCCFSVSCFFFTSSWREDSANQVTDKLNWLSLLLLMFSLQLFKLLRCDRSEGAKLSLYASFCCFCLLLFLLFCVRVVARTQPQKVHEEITILMTINYEVCTPAIAAIKWAKKELKSKLNMACNSLVANERLGQRTWLAKWVSEMNESQRNLAIDCCIIFTFFRGKKPLYILLIKLETVTYFDWYIT